MVIKVIPSGGVPVLADTGLPVTSTSTRKHRVKSEKSTQLSSSETGSVMPDFDPKNAQLNALRQAFAGPKFQLKFTDDALGAVVFLQTTDSETVYMIGFSGKRAKPDFHYSFRTLERAEVYQDTWHKGLVQRATDKAERKADKAAKLAAEPHTLVIGDVLVASWGYEQTNYNYYQITRLVGKQSVEIRELGRQVDATGCMQGDCVPVKGLFKGEPMVKRVTASGAVKVHSWGVWAYKMEPVKVAGVEIFKPNHFTSYA